MVKINKIREVHWTTLIIIVITNRSCRLITINLVRFNKFLARTRQDWIIKKLILTISVIKNKFFLNNKYKKYQMYQIETAANLNYHFNCLLKRSHLIKTLITKENLLFWWIESTIKTSFKVLFNELFIYRIKLIIYISKNN